MSWRNKLQGLSSQLNANLTDSAARLRQQLQQAAQSGGAAPGISQQAAAGDGSQQYVRLPVESAKKLRWFDRQDLNMLIQLHLREKQELFEANAALRQALQRRGVTESQLEQEVVLNNQHVDRLREEEAALGEVLAVAAQAEVERLREECDSLTTQLEHMRQRLMAAQQQAQQAQQQPLPGPMPPTSLPGSGTSAAAGKQAQQQQSRSEGEERVILRLDSLSDENPGGDDSSSVRVSLIVAPSEEVGAGAGPAAPLASLLQQLTGVCTLGSSGALEGAPHVDGALLEAAHAALASLAAQQGVTLPGVAAAAAASGAARGEGEEEAASVLQERCSQLQAANARLRGELEQSQQEAAFLKEAADRKVQEMRGRFSANQQHLQDLLRVAQDGRLEAEARCEAAERRLQLAEARAARLDSDAQDLKAEAKRVGQEVKRLERELAAAESKTLAAEAALQRAKGSAEAAEIVSQQRARISELVSQVQSLQRQLAGAQHMAESLEGRLAAAEAAAARATAELHDVEGVVAERDALAIQLSLLEARVDEVRVERNQLESHKALASDIEAKRARAEEELVTTARLAAALESRLAAAQRQCDALQLEVQAAEAARVAAVQSVAAEVALRWAAAGTDRTKWPPAAQDEMENLEARLAAMLTALKTAQAEAEEAAAAHEQVRLALAGAKRQLAATEEKLSKATREWQSRERQLEAASTAATLELGELRRAVAEVSQERDRLLEEKQARERAAQQAAAAVKAARRRTGSGSIAESVGNGSMAAPPPAPPSSSSAVGTPPLSRTSTGDKLPVLASQPSSLLQLKRDTLDATDLIYLKNVLLKFLDAQLGGRTGECEVLLPAVATLLRASPQEFKVLRDAVQRGSGPGVLDWLSSTSGVGGR